MIVAIAKSLWVAGLKILYLRGKGKNLLGQIASNGVGGGIVNLLSATTTVDTSFLTNNQANGNGGGAGLGGGGYNMGLSLYIIRTGT